jgi:AcrR family transcriptional regulator
MRNFAIVLSLILIGFMAAAGVRAQSPAPQSVQSTSMKQEPAIDAKVQVLQAEAQILKDFTQHLLATVYFSLATVVVVLITMVGFGWYQNFKVYERDKEALKTSLAAAFQEQLSTRANEIEQRGTKRFLEFDEKMADALKRTIQRTEDLELMFEASIFRSTHAAPTPRTDFMQFSSVVKNSIGKVSSHVMDYALSDLLDHVESMHQVDSSIRTVLIAIANELPRESAAYAERIREALATKPR